MPATKYDLWNETVDAPDKNACDKFNRHTSDRIEQIWKTKLEMQTQDEDNTTKERRHVAAGGNVLNNSI